MLRREFAGLYSFNLQWSIRLKHSVRLILQYVYVVQCVAGGKERKSGPTVRYSSAEKSSTVDARRPTERCFVTQRRGNALRAFSYCANKKITSGADCLLCKTSISSYTRHPRPRHVLLAPPLPDPRAPRATPFSAPQFFLDPRWNIHQPSRSIPFRLVSFNYRPTCRPFLLLFSSRPFRHGHLIARSNPYSWQKPVGIDRAEINGTATHEWSGSYVLTFNVLPHSTLNSENCGKNSRQ